MQEYRCFFMIMHFSLNCRSKPHKNMFADTKFNFACFHRFFSETLAQVADSRISRIRYSNNSYRILIWYISLRFKIFEKNQKIWTTWELR
jgi:hypothetical protein